MPHVIVKLWPGKSESQKKRLAEAITEGIMEIPHFGEESVIRGDARGQGTDKEWRFQ